jgi:queuine/archaeosine tRNA-ribosyltransferase
LLSMHNVHYLLNLMRRIREAVLEDRYPVFLKEYFATLYAGDKTKIPHWVVGALQGVGVDLMAD